MYREEEVSEINFSKLSKLQSGETKVVTSAALTQFIAKIKKRKYLHFITLLEFIYEKYYPVVSLVSVSLSSLFWAGCD